MQRKTMTNDAPAAVQPKPYEPTLQELAAAERLRARRKKHAPAPRFKVETAGNSVAIKADHADPSCTFALLADALGSADVVFVDGILNQLANASRTGEDLDALELNFMVATVQAVGPRDPTEALLAIQMAAIHNATMAAARRLNHTTTITQQDSASNMLNKLARTFSAQVETLKRYRADGEQKVTVQHQHVNVSANQAVVGISQGGGGAHEKSSQSHAPSEAGQSGPALLGHEQAVGLPLQSTGREGAAGVPHARRTRGGADGES